MILNFPIKTTINISFNHHTYIMVENLMNKSTKTHLTNEVQRKINAKEDKKRKGTLKMTSV